MSNSDHQLKMAHRIWGLDWREYLPLSLGDYTLDLSSYKEFCDLKQSPQNFIVTSEITDDKFIKDIGCSAKENFLKYHADFFTFKKDGKIVGVVSCDVPEWSSYYLRFIFIDKNHRSHSLTTKMILAFETIFKNYPLDKIICEVSSTNFGQVVRLSEIGFICSGNSLSERFGAMLRLTKYIREDSMRVFNQSFIQSMYNPKPQEGMKPFLSKPLKEYV